MPSLQGGGSDPPEGPSSPANLAWFQVRKATQFLERQWLLGRHRDVSTQPVTGGGKPVEGVMRNVWSWAADDNGSEASPAILPIII